MRSSWCFGDAAMSAGPCSSFFAPETVAPQQARAEGVEGADGELREALGTDQAIEPLAHLLGGLVCEGHGEDRTGRHALADEVSDAVREDARLPRSRAGQDEERAVA